MDFLQNGVQLVVSVGRSRSPFYAGKTMVQYSVNMLRGELPVPAQSEIIEFQDYPASNLKLNTVLNIANTVAFYDQAMSELRWQPVEDRQVSEDFANLLYRRGESTAEVTLRPADGGGTQVVADTTFTISEGVKQAQARASARQDARRQQEQREAMDALEHAIAVADFALPAGASEVFRNPHGSAHGGDIRFRTDDDLAANLKFFRDKLRPDQWTEDPAETHEQDGFGQLVFRKEKAWIKVCLTDTADGKGYLGMVEGTGLLAENDPRRSQPAEPETAKTPAPNADEVRQQLEAIREQVVREATQSGVSAEQLEQILKQLDAQLQKARAR
jgi:hypothetical protein